MRSMMMAARLPYEQGPAPHSFRSADERARDPGKTMRVRFALGPVAALIRRGHSFRLARADAGVFRRYSEAARRYDLMRPNAISR
jgi:hypothetical protein